MARLSVWPSQLPRWPWKLAGLVTLVGKTLRNVTQSLREMAELLRWAFFQPGRLQERLNACAPQQEGDTSFWHLLLNLGALQPARCFLFQFATLCCLFAFPFWLLLPWDEPGGLALNLLMAGALPLTGLGLGVWSLTLGMVAPALLGLALVVPDTRWAAVAALAGPQPSILAWRGPLAVLVGSGLGAGASWLADRAGERRGEWSPGARSAGSILAVGLAFVVAFGLAFGATAGLAFGVAFGLAVGVIFGGAIEIEGGVVLGVGVGTAVGMAFIVAFGVPFGLAAVAAFGLAVVISSGVAGGPADKMDSILVAVGVTAGVALGLAGIVAGAVAGVVAGILGVMVAGAVAGVASLLLADVVVGLLGTGVVGVAAFGAAGVAVLGLAATVAMGIARVGALPLEAGLLGAAGLGLALSARQRWWVGLAAALTYGALFVELGRWPVGCALAGVALAFFFRLPFYLPEALLNGWLALAAQMRPERAPRLLAASPVFYDDLIRYPLPKLDQLLVLAAEADRPAGLEAIVQVAASPCQGWAAREARFELAARSLARNRSLRDIARGRRELDWLPPANRVNGSRGGQAALQKHLSDTGRAVEAALMVRSPLNRGRQLNVALRQAETFQLALANMDRRTVERFYPVAEQWRAILLRETAREIPNPYIVGSPLPAEEAGLFTGRAELLRTMRGALQNGKASLALYGPRRVGKTTILYHLPRLLPADVLPVFMDLQQIAQAQRGNWFYYALAQSVTRQVGKRHGLAFPSPEIILFSAEPALALADWLDGVEAVLENRTVLLILDQFEWLGEAVAMGRWDRRVMGTLYHLMQHRPWLTLLLAGAGTLDGFGPRWHDFFIGVRPMRVGYLDERAARRLITNPIPDWPLDVPPAAVDRIIELTGCQPYLLQLACYELVNWFNTSSRRGAPNPRRVELGDVEQAAGAALRSGASYFAGLWDDAGDEGRPALALAAAEPEGVLLPARFSPATLERLVQLDLLSGPDSQVGGRWRVQVELTRRWLAGRVSRI